MAQPVGIDRTAVLAAAAAIVDGGGVGSLTLTEVAKRLGVSTPSLYAHVNGFEGLVRDLALDTLRQLGEELRSSVLGRSRREALSSVAHCYRTFASRHPGLYSMTMRDPGADEELMAANAHCASALRAVLDSFGLNGADNVHMYRAFWSAVHGFVSIETTGVMAMPVDRDESFRRTVDLFADHFERHESTPGASAPSAQHTRARGVGLRRSAPPFEAPL